MRRPAATSAAVPERTAALAVITVYVGTLLLLPWLPTGVRLGAAIVTAVAAALAWLPTGGKFGAEAAAASGVVLHLLLLASGGLRSPLLVLIVPWFAWVTLPLGMRRRILTGAAAATALVATDAWARGGFTRVGTLEALLAIGCALGIGGWIGRTHRRLEAQEDALSRILDEAGAGRAAGDKAEAARRLDELTERLDRLRATLGAGRAVLWDVDPDVMRAKPRLTSGAPAPTSIPLSGDPLAWAWEEGVPLRIENESRWAATNARACIIPLEPGGRTAAILSLSFAEDVELPPAEALDAAASQLRTLLQLHRREASTVAARERLAHLTSVLQQLPRVTTLDDLAGEIASAAAQLASGTGAAVALWEDESGLVLAAAGDDGGPAVGSIFGPLESEMALAARHGTTLIRDRRSGDAKSLPVAVRGERWLAAPGALLVVPMIDRGHGVVGVVAVWRSEPGALDPAAVDTLETLAPYAAIQLRQSRIYGDLREHAEHDALTGLFNRRAFEERFRAEAAAFHRYRRPLSLIVLDIDHFKRINDTYGHEAGDAALRAVAACIRASIREVDVPARYGGEEFVALLPETGLAGARGTADRLRRRVEEAVVEWRGQRIAIQASLGVASAPECVDNPAALVASADAALYASKRGGRNRVSAAPLGVDRDA